jgi:hypothetical protein
MAVVGQLLLFYFSKIMYLATGETPKEQTQIIPYPSTQQLTLLSMPFYHLQVLSLSLSLFVSLICVLFHLPK